MDAGKKYRGKKKASTAPQTNTKTRRTKKQQTHRSMRRLSRNGERSTAGWQVGVGRAPLSAAAAPGGLLVEGPRRAQARAMMVSPVVR